LGSLPTRVIGRRTPGLCLGLALTQIIIKLRENTNDEYEITT